MPRLHRKLVYVIVGSALVLLIYSLSNFGERIDPWRRIHRHQQLNDRDVVVMTPVTMTKNRPPDKEKDSQGAYEDVGVAAGGDVGDGGGGGGRGESPREDAAAVEDAAAESLQNDLAEVDLDTPPVSVKMAAEVTSSRYHVSFAGQFKGAQNSQQRAIVEAFGHAWTGYRKYAWGLDELRPLSKSGQQWMGVGLTIIDSLDTIIIMGLHDEYKVAREWIANSLNFEFDGEIQLFEMTIRTLGGLLSAYHLTNDELFLNKAIELGTKFSPCFGGVTRVPCNRINLKRFQPTFVDISTAESGSIQLEFRDLSRSSNDTSFEMEVSAVSDHLHYLPKLDGLVSCFLNPLSGSFVASSAVSFGASADSYYEYLLKQWIQTGKTREWLKTDYLTAIDGMKRHLLRYSEPSKLAFVGSMPSLASIGHVRNEMEHLSCFLPGVLALGVIHGLDKTHLQLAADLTTTCYKMYEMMPTKLSPEIAVMNTDASIKEDISTQYNMRYNLQRPETVESIFYMYRATKNPMYREWGWKIFEAFEKYTRVDAGYASIDNVLSPENPGHRDKMETFYLAETLKYLFLLFSDDADLLPLDRYVMNTEAHPLPIYAS